MSKELPEGWTDDMTFPVGGGYSETELVKWLLETIESRRPYESTIAELMSRFELSEDDAHLAQDHL